MYYQISNKNPQMFISNKLVYDYLLLFGCPLYDCHFENAPDEFKYHKSHKLSDKIYLHNFCPLLLSLCNSNMCTRWCMRVL